MPFEPSEIVNLVLLVALVPMVLVAIRRVLPTMPKAIIIAAVAMSCAYVLTILEGFLLTDLLNLLEHAALAVAGVAFLVTIVTVRRALSEEATR